MELNKILHNYKLWNLLFTLYLPTAGCSLLIISKVLRNGDMIHYQYWPNQLYIIGIGLCVFGLIQAALFLGNKNIFHLFTYNGEDDEFRGDNN